MHCHMVTVDMHVHILLLQLYFVVFRVQSWYHCTPEKNCECFSGALPWAVHNVSNAHHFNACCIIAHCHRSPPIDHQNSSSTVEPEDPAVCTKRARMMPDSKIYLPSSDVEEYSGNALIKTIARISNPKGMILYLATGWKLYECLVGFKCRNIYRSDNRPSWWPKDLVFSTVSGTIVYSL